MFIASVLRLPLRADFFRPRPNPKSGLPGVYSSSGNNAIVVLSRRVDASGAAALAALPGSA
jgi:hypothetical protein